VNAILNQSSLDLISSRVIYPIIITFSVYFLQLAGMFCSRLFCCLKLVLLYHNPDFRKPFLRMF